jgi:NAD dependent epimerase/dehydratase family enzyme
MGEMGIVLGRRVSSDKIEQVGFQFKFKNLELH